MTKRIFLIQVALLLGIREAVGFLPTVPYSNDRIATTILLPPLHSIIENDRKTNVFDSGTRAWKDNLLQIFDVNGDGKVDHKDAGSIAALACLTWSLMSAPAMAQGSSNSSSRSSSRSVPTARSSRSYRTSSSTRSSSRKTSSSLSSSSSRRTSSPYRSIPRSPSSSRSKSNQPPSNGSSGSSSSSSQASRSSKTKFVSSTPSSSSKSSSMVGKRVTISTPKSSSARLVIKPNNKKKTTSSNTAASSASKSLVIEEERIATRAPPSSSARMRASKPKTLSSTTPASSSPTKATKVESSKLNPNLVSSPSASPVTVSEPSTKATSKIIYNAKTQAATKIKGENTKAKGGPITVNSSDSTLSSTKRIHSTGSSPTAKSPQRRTNTITGSAKIVSPTRESNADKKKKMAISTDLKKEGSSSPLKKNDAMRSLQQDLAKKKAANAADGIGSSKKGGYTKSSTKSSTKIKTVSERSSTSTDKVVPRKRSGKRVGGRAANPSESRESTQIRDRQTIIRNNYIIVDPPSARYYPGNAVQYYPPRNLGTAYYYNDYAPRLEEQRAYPPYRRPTCATSGMNRRKEQQSICSSDLPIENEPIDILVDPIRGLYVQGSVTSVNPSNYDFTATYLSADGYPVQKTFHAVPSLQAPST